MNGIFHYYALKFLALRGGLDEASAETLAFSSQLVDHAVIPIEVHSPKGTYSILPTHHFGFWDKRQEDAVWIPFHFFPSGDVNCKRRKDGKEQLEITRPNSGPVKELLVEALKSRNLYRIGIAMHTYADSWAHQDFIGRNSPLNRIEAFSPIPPAGHAQMGRVPDRWSLDWIDPRLNESLQICSNNTRFFQAAEKLYKYIATYCRRDFSDWEIVKWELEEICLDNSPGPPGAYPRKNAAAEDHVLPVNFRIELSTDELDPKRWHKMAFPDAAGDLVLGASDAFASAQHEISKLMGRGKPRRISCGDDFFSSHLYKWSEAARDQLSSAQHIIKRL